MKYYFWLIAISFLYKAFSLLKYLKLVDKEEKKKLNIKI